MTFQHKRLVLAFSLPLMIRAAALIGLPTAAFGQSPAEEDKEVLYWYDPMVPQQKFDKPGKSPFMDMELIPRYADEGSDGASISIDPSVTQTSLSASSAPTQTQPKVAAEHVWYS